MNLINLKKENLFKASLALAVGLSLGFTSCKDNDDKYETPKLEVVGISESDAISFAKDGGVQEFTIKANRKWSITSDADWLSFDPKSGDAGEVIVRVTALANSATPRTANFTINGLSTPKVISVNQAGEGGNADFSVVIFEEKFEKLDLGCFTIKGLDEGSNTWGVKEFKGDNYLNITAYGSKTDKTRAYLISPEIKFTAPTKLSFQYKPAHARPGTTLKVLLLDANKEPLGNALKVLDPSEPAKGFAKTYTDEVIMIPAREEAKYFALFYEGDKEHTTTFQIDNFKLEGSKDASPVNCSGKENTDPTPAPNPPATNPTEAVKIFNETFESTAVKAIPDGWTSIATKGNRAWQVKEFNGNKSIEFSSYKSNGQDEVTLFSPMLDIDTEKTLSFDLGVRFEKAGTILKVVAFDANKKQITELKSYDLATNGIKKETIAIPNNAKIKYIGFIYIGEDGKYTSTAQLDNIVLSDSTPAPVPAPNPVPTPPAPTSGEIFFLDYIEGSGSEKYLSIYNPTDQDITLNGYSIVVEQYNNSNKKAKGANPSLKLDGKVIKAMSTLVFSNGGANNKPEGTITDNSVCNFNGNDNIYIEKNGNVIDVIGNAKGSAWINGTDFAGADKGLHRKNSVNAPSETFKIEEWEVLGKDDVSKLGKR